MTQSNSNSNQSPPPKSGKIIIGILGLFLLLSVIGNLFFPAALSWETSDAGPETTSGESGTWYISQMHPWIIQPNPGQCPICGMDLTPVDPDRFAGEMSIDPVVVQNMGVRIRQAESGPITRKIRTVGVVTIDPSKVSDINLRFAGWVEKVHVNAQWDRVEKNAPLLDIYSPEILSAEKEFVIALNAAESNQNASLLNAARKRLVLLGIPHSEIKRLQSGGAAQEIVTLTAPHAGIVLQKNINSGSKVQPQTLAYQIADLSQVWVEATIYEQHLPFIHTGQESRIQLNYGEKQTLQGKIAYIYPVVNKATRETKARFVFDNSDGLLKPDMFATVEIVQDSPAMVRIPQEAVIGTGERNVVFVSLGRGRFEPRNVTTGPQGNGFIGIKSGIEIGEQVVTSGQFLLDSESKMREALAKVMKGDLASQQAPTAKQTDAVQIEIDKASKTALKNALDHYLKWQQNLYKDDITTATQAVSEFKLAFITFVTTAKAQDEHIHHRLAAIESLQKELETLQITTLADIRKQFGSISVDLDLIIKSIGPPTEFANNLAGMRCSMAKGIRDGGVWIQFGPDVQNPFFGISNDMRDCAADTWAYQSSTGNSKQLPVPKTIASDIKPPSEKPSPAVPVPELVIKAYLEIQRALFENNLVDAQAASKHLNKAFADAGVTWKDDEHLTHGVMHAKDLKTARIAFGSISISLRNHLQKSGSNMTDLRVFQCGMARDIPEKGVWLQISDEINNPYFGHEHGMSDCAMKQWQVQNNGMTEVE